MKRTITIDAPFCDTNGEVCPYLGPCEPEREDEQPPRIVCLGVEDEETRMGFWREVIHTFDPDGPGYRRHSECPFGNRDIQITMRDVKQSSTHLDKCRGLHPARENHHKVTTSASESADSIDSRTHAPDPNDTRSPQTGFGPPQTEPAYNKEVTP